MTTVADLALHERGRVVRVNAADEAGMRLMEMGLIPGIELTIIGAAPLGDPLELEVRGYRLSVRKSEGRAVEVERLPPRTTQ